MNNDNTHSPWWTWDVSGTGRLLIDFFKGDAVLHATSDVLPFAHKAKSEDECRRLAEEFLSPPTDLAISLLTYLPEPEEPDDDDNFPVGLRCVLRITEDGFELDIPPGTLRNWVGALLTDFDEVDFGILRFLSVLARRSFDEVAISIGLADAGDDYSTRRQPPTSPKDTLSSREMEALMRNELAKISYQQLCNFLQVKTSTLKQRLREAGLIPVERSYLRDWTFTPRQILDKLVPAILKKLTTPRFYDFIDWLESCNLIERPR